MPRADLERPESLRDLRVIRQPGELRFRTDRTVLRGRRLEQEDDSTHPTTGALREDTWTCNELLSLALQRLRGFEWGNICRTVNRLPDDGGDLVCSYCRQAS